MLPPARGKEDRILCYFDGACPGNQFGEKGPMRAAYVVGDEAFVRGVPDLATRRGWMRSNNVAEYHGLLFLLQDLRGRERGTPQRRAYRICGDSQLVVRQMLGEYRVRNPNLEPLWRQAQELAAGLDLEFRWIRRDQNKAGRLLE